MSREQAARDWAIKKYPENVIHAGDFSQDVNYGRRVTHKEAFIAGWDAGQKQLFAAELAEKDEKIADYRNQRNLLEERVLELEGRIKALLGEE